MNSNTSTPRGRETGKPNESETLFTTGGLNGPYYLYTTGESDSTASTTSIRFTDRGMAVQ